MDRWRTAKFLRKIFTLLATVKMITKHTKLRIKLHQFLTRDRHIFPIVFCIQWTSRHRLTFFVLNFWRHDLKIYHRFCFDFWYFKTAETRKFDFRSLLKSAFHNSEKMLYHFSSLFFRNTSFFREDIYEFCFIHDCSIYNLFYLEGVLSKLRPIKKKYSKYKFNF